jgi:glutamine---fructose-6-phosphate transaminase (isomerizing)
MCGIFGIITKPVLGLSANVLESAMLNVFKLSETRGKDASGALVLLPDQIEVIKSAQRVSHLIAQPEFKQLMARAKDSYKAEAAFVVVGHTRMATNGTAQEEFNNQPVIKDGHLILHNGIIVNDEDLWRSNLTLQREYQTDTEIFGALLGAGADRGQTLAEAMQAAFLQIKGGNTIAALRLDQDQIVIGTSNGSMYFWKSLDKKTVVFASERLIVERTAKRLQEKEEVPLVQQLKPGRAFSVDLTNATMENFSLTDDQPKLATMKATKARQLVQIPLGQVGGINATTFINKLADIERLMKFDQESIRHIKRCTRCLLPETFPFISFDEKGVCQICRQHQPRELRGVDALQRIAEKARRSNGRPDCLVPISGGRDSCYGLHYVKKELGLNPVAYTYDWGLVTDLARRNISRMCGSLGVEHVLIAADIRQKRENVRKNITAWIKAPTLGMIPLFMAGDKMFFYYASLIRRQMELGPILFSMNWLEKTGFKNGFANVNDIPDMDASVKGKTYDMSIKNKIKLLGYYGKQFLSNMEYLNSSMPDTLFAFFSYYLQRKDYDSIFDYLPWDEKTIENTIIQGYDWETSPDSSSTWRIGDGTAAFYNYVYLSVAGFSEYDTFRSNQIREGLITREKALSLIEEENQPRLESFKWYCDNIGIDAIAMLNVINKIPKLYPH